MRLAAAFFSVTFALFLTACAPHLGTKAERTASFEPYQESKIGNQSAWDYLLVRTGWLVSSDGLEVRSSSSSARAAGVRFRGGGKALQFGTAAAIDARGYFLTAAHNLQETKAPYIAFYQRGHVIFVPTRVVWKGNERKGEADLAVLHVSMPLDAVFSWGSVPSKGDRALSAGLDFGRRFKFQIVCLGGSIDYLFDRPKPAPGHKLIFHRTPLHPGDSGGPMVTPEGRLLGINTEIYPKNLFRVSPFTQYSAAQRPEPEEIQRLIEADVAQREGAARRREKQSGRG